MKKWNILYKQKTKKSRQIKDREIINILLHNRGITKKKEIEKFLNHSLEPINLDEIGLDEKEIVKAVKRISKAIENKESVVVYTDYDVDGLTGGAIIWETLFEKGAKIMPYVPHRIHEGYGLSKRGIENIISQYHPSLLITVDHGISAGKFIDYAKDLGIETIIIDHHQKPQKLPAAHAIIHSAKMAAGAICWLFASYMKSTPESSFNKFLYDNLDLAALATIADMIPLTGINRSIVKYGLEQLNKTKRIGLKALIETSSLQHGEIGVFEVGRILSPRINALGRLSHAMDALRLLCTKNEERASFLAKTLGDVNRERQIITQDAISRAIKLIDVQKNQGLIFATHYSFQQGVIGLVAGRLAEQFNRPAIVVSQGEVYSKASVRSIAGIDILKVMRGQIDLLEDLGGHPMAAGFTVLTKNLEKLEKRLRKELIKSQLDSVVEVIDIDMELRIDKIDEELYEQIQKLSPFGIGNPDPIFISYGTKIAQISLVGKEKKHLKLLLESGPDSHLAAIGFNLGWVYHDLKQKNTVDIVYVINQDNWNEEKRLQLLIKDVKLTH